MPLRYLRTCPRTCYPESLLCTHSEEQALPIWPKSSRRQSKCPTYGKNKPFLTPYSPSHIWGNRALAAKAEKMAAVLPRTKGHLPSQTVVPGPVWVTIRKEYFPPRPPPKKPHTRTYPLACQCPLWKSVLRPHHHSLLDACHAQGKEGDIRSKSRPKTTLAQLGIWQMREQKAREVDGDFPGYWISELGVILRVFPVILLFPSGMKDLYLQMAYGHVKNKKKFDRIKHHVQRRPSWKRKASSRKRCRKQEGGRLAVEAQVCWWLSNVLSKTRTVCLKVFEWKYGEVEEGAGTWLPNYRLGSFTM